MVKTLKHHADETLVLRSGDHPFIRHPSSVHYSTAQCFKVSSIVAAMTDGRCHLKEDMTEELLGRARGGLVESPYAVHAMKRYLEDQVREL